VPLLEDIIAVLFLLVTVNARLLTQLNTATLIPLYSYSYAFSPLIPSYSLLFSPLIPSSLFFSLLLSPPLLSPPHLSSPYLSSSLPSPLLPSAPPLLSSQMNDRLNTLQENTRINDENMKITDSLLALTQDRVGQVLVVQSDLQATRDAVCAIELCVVEVQRRLDNAFNRCG
jgi:hypothetical protein